MIAITAWVYSHSLWAPEDTIRTSLLKETPLGTAKADVQNLVQQHGWADTNFSGELGLHVTSSGQRTITTCIGGRLGHYSFPNSTFVLAVWEFDPSNRLVEITVTKASDEP